MTNEQIAKHLAEIFDCPCNFEPLDEEIGEYCDEKYGDCCNVKSTECWRRVLEKWEQEDDEK